MFSINFALERVGLPILGRDWTKGFYDEEAKAQMKAHGWCPSDVSFRVALNSEKFYGVEIL
jgi:hypothetical protein